MVDASIELNHTIITLSLTHLLIIYLRSYYQVLNKMMLMVFIWVKPEKNGNNF